MIFPTTFFLALFLAPIARAVPQPCHDSISPGSSTPVGQYNLENSDPMVATFKAIYSSQYDNGTQTLNDIACANLEEMYSEFHDLPFFPFIGGAIYTTFNSPNCGAIWKIKNFANGKHIYFVSIDSSDTLDLSEHAFRALGGLTSEGSVNVEAEIVGHIIT